MKSSVRKLPPSFRGDPDPRHRERLFGGGVPLVTFSDLAEAVRGQTSALEKRCIASVLKQKGSEGSARDKLSRAYAICRASLQKSGRISRGGMDLTKLGRAISKVRSRRKDHGVKVRTFEKAVRSARGAGK